jgi:gamma-glutamylcyclotransferase (GGCT)/AIG2-like uncharacterized protein YtfP
MRDALGYVSIALFAYGTLELQEVISAVTGASFQSSPTRLRDYRRRLLRGEVYPAIVPDSGAITEGVLYEGLTPEALAHIDVFEADQYDRKRVQVERLAGSGREPGRIEWGYAYVLRSDHYAMMTDVHWDPEVFRSNHLSEFLHRQIRS